MEVVYNKSGDKVIVHLEQMKRVFTNYYDYTYYRNDAHKPQRTNLYKNFDFSRMKGWMGMMGYKFTGDYLRYWPTFLNFAIYHSTSSLGISKEQLHHQDPYIKAIFVFHFYYHLFRIIEIMEVKMPGDEGFNYYDNYYSKKGYHQVVSKYGGGSKPLVHFQLSLPNGTHAPVDLDTGITSKWQFIADKSGGINRLGLLALDETVCNYFYLVLSSQVNARVGFPDLEPIRVFAENFNFIIKQRINTSDTVSRYQKLLSNAITPPDFVVWKGVYMVPSNAGLSIKKQVGFNDMLVKAGEEEKNIPIKHTIVQTSPIISNTGPVVHKSPPIKKSPKINNLKVSTDVKIAVGVIISLLIYGYGNGRNRAT